MIRAPDLPCLPGFTVNLNVGQTKYHLSHHFDYLNGCLPYTTEKSKPGIGGAPLPGSAHTRYPSIYARGDVTELPPWIAFDKHMLSFDAYYIDPLATDLENKFAVHKCKVYFFLEDGTVKVVEPQLLNSGSPQGCLIKRQRIRYPAVSNSNDFYDIIDFNIGRELEFFSKKFTLTNCDSFTRIFLNRLGIPVPEPIMIPHDPYMTKRQVLDVPHKKINYGKKAVVNRFLTMDNRILSFKAFWDDRQTEYGYLHLLKINYYLIDDTIEIQDITDSTHPFLIGKRAKLPKQYEGLPPPGDSETTSLLNVLGGAREKPRYVVDPLGAGLTYREYYTDKDLTIGGVINSYGRKFVIESCDKFTQDYYRLKYGVDDFTPYPRPMTKEEEEISAVKKIEQIIAPYNGFGSYEDSLLNCFTVNPFSVVKSYKQFYEKDRDGYDSKILRFLALMIAKNELGPARKFIICYYLSDDSLSVYDEVPVNSGYTGGMLISRRKVLKPGQMLYSTKPHEFYTFNDLYIGNTVILDNFEFLIIGADEYALRYMERHPNEFPKGNVRLVLDKLRNAIKTNYKEFAAQFLRDNEFVPAPYEKFREAIKRVLGDKITEHEILILARHYCNKFPKEMFNLQTLQRFAHDILKNQLFEEFDRLREAFLYYDPDRKGFVTKDQAYCVLRGAKLPLDVEFVKLLLEKIGKGERCQIYYEQFIDFINYKKHILRPIQPINISATLSWLNLCRPESFVKVDYVLISKLIDDLQLEVDLKQQCT